MGRFLIVIAIAMCSLAGCLPTLPAPYYQKEVAIPQFAWPYSFKPVFTFDVTDTTVEYLPFFLIRHTQAYPYNNIWVWISVKMPGDSVARKERINVPLAENNGKWLGRGMGEIYEQRLRISLGDSIKFTRPGTYQVSIEQNMRVTPLPEVLHVGFRLEKGLLRR